MNKHMICIECPVGCALSVDYDGQVVFGVSGHKCPKGKEYALAEIRNPQRIVTSTVLCEGLSVKLLPVRTETAIPRQRIFEAVAAIRKLRVKKPVSAGEVLAEDFLGLGVRLIATRTVR